MTIYAISDLHLSETHEKPMDIFGSQWERHFEKIREDWLSRVSDEDAVLMPGDLSWAMHLRDAVSDILRISELPGKKLIIRGNHDYWWNSITQVRTVLPPGFDAIQNDSLILGTVVIAGSRGWTCPGPASFTPEDNRIYLRELQRMELSLSHARARSCDHTLIAMIHFPPFNEKAEPSGFTELFKKYGVKKVVYGHIHGKGLQNAFEGIIDDISYTLVSCDHTGFKLKPIHES
jgi:uncharacterized protein